MNKNSDNFTKHDKRPLVSVVMNCYNGEKYLNDAVHSVLIQTYTDLEIIFWDNQSTDSSAEIFKNYTDPRLKYYYAPEHTLLYEARNYAIENAAGEFIAFLDVDDEWLPDKLEKQMLLFSDPEVGLVCGNYWIQNKRKEKRWKALAQQAPTGRVLNDLLGAYFVGLVTLVIRRSALEMLNYPCDPRYHIIGDFDLVIRLSVYWKLDCIQEPIALYRLHAGNESAKHRGRHVNELKCWLEEMGKNETIRSCRNWPSVKNNYIYLKAINESLQGRKKAVYDLFQKFPWGMQKLRLLLALILPTVVVRKLKN